MVKRDAIRVLDGGGVLRFEFDEGYSQADGGGRVDDDGDGEEKLEHEDCGGYFAEEENEDDGSDGEGVRGGEVGELP